MQSKEKFTPKAMSIAWTAADMPQIDPQLIDMDAIKQKKRSLALERQKDKTRSKKTLADL